MGNESNSGVSGSESAPIDRDAPTMVTPPSGHKAYGTPPPMDETMPVGAGAHDPDATLPTMGGSADYDPDATLPTLGGAAQNPRPGSSTPATLAAGQAAGAMPDLTGQVIGDFRIEGILGQGGMGAVYRGSQVSLDRPVAIKVLPAHLSKDAQFIERFQLEAKAVAKLVSPYIIQVYGAGEAEGMHFFAMELVDGKDLSDRMKEGFRPTPKEALDLTIQAAKGLAAAGKHGIIHRDIKPHNMMVTDSGELKIMDFGLVKMDSQVQGLTMTGAVMGTVSYFSPEQGRGERCDCRTDIYALGVVLYEILTGALPFVGPDATSVIYQQIHSAPRLPVEINPEIPEELQAVVLKCMQKNRDDRYQTADELLADLELIKNGMQPAEALKNPELLMTGAMMQKASGFSQQQKSSSAALWVLIIVLILAAAGAGGFFWWQQQEAIKQKELERQQALAVADAAELARLAQETAQTDPDMLAVTSAINAGDYEGAAQLLAALPSDDAKWQALRTRLHTLRVQTLVDESKAAIADGAFDKARHCLSDLEELAPQDARLDPLKQELAQTESLQKELGELKAFLDAGQASQALTAAETYAAQHKGAGRDALMDFAEKARAMHELHKAADERLLHDDYKSARDMLSNSMLQHPNEFARKALGAVDTHSSFEQSLAAKDYPAAQKALADLLRFCL